MQKSIWFLTAALFVLSSNSHATDECYPSDRADAYIKDLQIAPVTFEGGLDLCRANSQLVQFFKTLDFIKDTALPETKRPPFVPGILPADYFGYFKGRVRFVNGPLRGCPMSVSTFACTGGLGELVIGPDFYNQRIPVRASYIIHELRHWDGDFRHTGCTQGNEKGDSKGCDDTFEEQGTYAVQLEYLARVYFFAAKLSDDDRIAAKGFALYLAQNKFNTSKLTSGKAVLLADAADGKLVLFDGREARSYAAALPEGRAFARDRNFNITSPKQQNSYLFDPYLAAEFQADEVLNDPEAIGWAFVNFNKTPHTELLDSIRFGSRGEQAMLYNGRLEIVGPGSSKAIPLGGTKVQRFVKDLPCAGAGDGLYALDADGRRIWNLRAPAGPEIVQCQWPEGIQNYAVLDGGAVALLKNGALVTYPDQKPLAQLQGRRFRSMVRLKEPFYPGFIK